MGTHGDGRPKGIEGTVLEKQNLQVSLSLH